MRFDFPPDSPLHLFSEDEVRAIFAAGRERTCAVDEVLVTEGEPGDSMFFLLDGYAGARLDSGAMARSYGPGSYFGELSFINPGHRRSATIVATTAARLQVLDQASIHALAATHPRAIVTLLRRTCSFLVDAERNLFSDLRRRNAELRMHLEQLELARRRLGEEQASARTDALTGLSNRRAFDLELPGLMARAKERGTGLALLALDLDQFKQVNDSLGHAAGDEVLVGVARVLQRGLRRSDLSCRFGGDEFVVALVDLTAADAQARAETLRAELGVMPHPGTEQGLRVTATLGGTLYRAGESLEALLERADGALLEAKRAGRNRVKWAA